MTFRRLFFSTAIILAAANSFSYAQSNGTDVPAAGVVSSSEKPDFPLGIELYKPTYVLPLYYTHKPYYKMYKGRTPKEYKGKGREDLSAWDFKFQISFGVPVAKDIFGSRTDFYFAYTQMSYWQLYVTNSFFRETNYEPEFFLKHHFSSFFSMTAGAVHQSNGVGDKYERAWNRLYAEATFQNDRWRLDLRAWQHIFKSDEEFNSNIMDYMGYGQATMSVRLGNNTLSVYEYNFVESEFKKGSAGFSWSYQLSSNARVYMALFHGYGQSLIEYNHRVTSGGLGISLNDWL
jgi:phospholipase A1